MKRSWFLGTFTMRIDFGRPVGMYLSLFSLKSKYSSDVFWKTPDSIWLIPFWARYNALEGIVTESAGQIDSDRINHFRSEPIP